LQERIRQRRHAQADTVQQLQQQLADERVNADRNLQVCCALECAHTRLQLYSDEQRRTVHVQGELERRKDQCREMMDIVEKLKSELAKERHQRIALDEEKQNAQRQLANTTLSHEAELMTLKCRLKSVIPG
jgi:hypothetical protein